MEGAVHKRNVAETSSICHIDNFVHDRTHVNKVMATELIMSQFIAAHILTFWAEDHFSDMFSMFPDSKLLLICTVNTQN